jgi:cytochrome c553
MLSRKLTNGAAISSCRNAVVMTVTCAAAICGLAAGDARLAAARADEARKLAYGRHLAQECTSCHRVDGKASGIPSIVGLDPEVFKAALDAFAKGERPNQVMVSVARSLDQEQSEALAHYFASLPKR